MTPGADPPTPLKFSNEIKLRRQMSKRGWSDDLIRSALAMTDIATVGKRGPATRYVHPTNGKSIIVDNATGEIFHVGGEGFKYG